MQSTATSARECWKNFNLQISKEAKNHLKILGDNDFIFVIPRSRGEFLISTSRSETPQPRQRPCLLDLARMVLYLTLPYDTNLNLSSGYHKNYFNTKKLH